MSSRLLVRAAAVDDVEFLVDGNARMAWETERLELDRERLRAGVEAVFMDGPGPEMLLQQASRHDAVANPTETRLGVSGLEVGWSMLAIRLAAVWSATPGRQLVHPRSGHLTLVGLRHCHVGKHGHHCIHTHSHPSPQELGGYTVPRCWISSSKPRRHFVPGAKN